MIFNLLIFNNMMNSYKINNFLMMNKNYINKKLKIFFIIKINNRKIYNFIIV